MRKKSGLHPEGILEYLKFEFDAQFNTFFLIYPTLVVSFLFLLILSCLNLLEELIAATAEYSVSASMIDATLSGCREV